ncbi:dmsr-5 [Pristionchus pacificus]|uniref:Dmsr-5 n=1 Tax=Pristionchus pacificus TaxID=54126 RepID=A0A2A6CHX6_PRIPA|nr:dmsr-5 [Pristionchus pacificus]|eukprot:PDM77690.1 dmsr-5 [Pristionchus pacificus]
MGHPAWHDKYPMCENDNYLFDLKDNETHAFLASLEAFGKGYTIYHRWICAFVCSFGILLNCLHIIVLTRNPMRVYIINNILSVIAVCDVTTMASYLIYLIKFKFLENDDVIGHSYFWLVFLLAHVVSSIALHTVSLYLSVIMAFIRWNALDRLDSKWVKSRSIGSIFCLTLLFVMLISISNLAVHDIVPTKEIFAHIQLNGTEMNLDDDLYTVSLRSLALDNDCVIFKSQLWLTGIFFKVIPCMLLLWFTVALMIKLYEMSRKRRLLRRDDTRKKSAVDKTTVMLIIMLTVFLFTELPQGAIAILNAIYTTDVHVNVYLHIGEILDLLSLVNCNVGFVLYCCMSSRYRHTFRSLFLTRLEKTKAGRKDVISAFHNLIS